MLGDKIQIIFLFLKFVDKGNPDGQFTTIFKLPTNMKPSRKLSFACVIFGISGVPGRVDVFPNGNVKCFSYDTAGISLSGISFLAD